MAGNISNTNVWDPADTGRQAEVRAMFEEMVGWAVDGGAECTATTSGCPNTSWRWATARDGPGPGSTGLREFARTCAEILSDIQLNRLGAPLVYLPGGTTAHPPVAGEGEVSWRNPAR